MRKYTAILPVTADQNIISGPIGNNPNVLTFMLKDNHFVVDSNWNTLDINLVSFESYNEVSLESDKKIRFNEARVIWVKDGKPLKVPAILLT